MEEIKDRNAYVKATMADGVAILEGTTTWCSQCRNYINDRKLVKKYPDARFYKYDTEEAEDVAQELGVNMMPSFHIFKDGDVMESVTGAKGAQLEKAISSCYDGKVVEE